MGSNRFKTSQKKWVPLIFHLVLWTVWIGLPIVNSGDNERFRIFSIWLIPVSLTNIPLFFLNTEWLIPRLLRQKGVATYLFSLLLLIGAFAAIHFSIKEWFIPEDIRFNRNGWFWAVIPVVFVTAISTGYGFIQYLLQQENDRKEGEQERLTSELSFLRSQISPHFIFNILNSIVYLIRSRSDLAESVTIKLSELMRYLLYQSPEEQVPLSQEVEYLRNYIDLQRIRFEEEVDIRFEITEQGDSPFIEPMMLIPFVENAFKHGVGLVANPIIEVKLGWNQAQLHFSVHNKIGPETKESKDESSGIGLRNVSRRLELLYPDSHQLDIQQENEWFEVHLQLTFSPTKSLSPASSQPPIHEAPLPDRR